MARGEKVSETLGELSRTATTRVRLQEDLFAMSVKSLKELLGLTKPEKGIEIGNKESLKNFMAEVEKTDPELMGHLKLTYKARSLEIQSFDAYLTTHYLLAAGVLVFLFLTPVWIQDFIPPPILESIDVFQPEMIVLVFLLYVSLILAIKGALALIGRFPSGQGRVR